MSVTRKGTHVPTSYETLAVKAGLLADATYPAQTLKNAKTGATMEDPRAGMHVATIGAALEYGTGQNHPRPFMQTTVARERAAWVEGLVKLVKGGMTPEAALAVIGQTMKEDIQTTINDWPADNAEAWAEFKGFNKGLVFSSHLLNSVSSAIVNKDEA